MGDVADLRDGVEDVLAQPVDRRRGALRGLNSRTGNGHRQRSPPEGSSCPGKSRLNHTSARR